MTYNSLIELNGATQSVKNVFCLHTAGGGLEAYKGLANYFEDKFKFYGIEEPSIFDDFVYNSMQEVAEHHAKVIKTVQSSGPYILFGYCSGGPIAHEVANQLRLQGDSVESVTYFNRRVYWYDPTDKTKYFFLKSYLSAKYGMNFDSIDWDLCESQSIDYLVDSIIRVFIEHGLDVKENDYGWIKKVVFALCLMKNACINYRPPNVDFDVFQIDKEDKRNSSGVLWCDFQSSKSMMFISDSKYNENGTMDLLVEPNFSITKSKVEEFILN